MISSIPSNNTFSFHSVFLTPFAEGALRVKNFAQGTDFTLIDQPKRPLSDRVVDLIVGLALLIPLLNAIIWIALHNIGNMQSLSKNPAQASEPWIEALEASEEAPSIHVPILIPPADTAPKKVESYQLEEQENGEPSYVSTLTIEHHPEVILVKSVAPKVQSESVYDTDWTLQSMHYKDDNKSLDVTFTRVGATVILTGNKKGEELNLKFDLLNPSIPWIQQLSQGTKPFIQGPENNMLFYAINPEDLSLTLGKLQKTKIEEVPEHGRTVKIEMRATTWPKNMKSVRESLHHPVTGHQFQEDWYVPFFYSATSKIIK
jgi:hypothetical protein